MDIDGFIQSMPSAEVWKKLWDQTDGTEGLGIGHESKLVDDLLIAIERRSGDQECRGVCDGCGKVCCPVDHHGEPEFNLNRHYADHTFIVYTALISIPVPHALKMYLWAIGMSSDSGIGHFLIYQWMEAT